MSNGETSMKPDNYIRYARWTGRDDRILRDNYQGFDGHLTGLQVAKLMGRTQNSVLARVKALRDNRRVVKPEYGDWFTLPEQRGRFRKIVHSGMVQHERRPGYDVFMSNADLPEAAI